MPQNAAPAGPFSAPRILCLHGGGTNAAIFRFQLRAIISRSKENFRFVFVEAPFISPAHEAVAEVFADFAPFRRWLRFLKDHEEIEDDVAAAEIVKACRDAMEKDDKAGSKGEWVGLLGFSQGAKIAASLLWAQQIFGMRAKDGEKKDSLLNARFKFGVLMNGRYPIIKLSPDLPENPYIAPAGHLFSEEFELPTSNSGEHVCFIPTVHVHGLQDPGLQQHREMKNLWFAPGSARLVQWDGDHRLPIKPADVDEVLTKIYDLAESAGIDITREDGHYY